jgi:hypothetical protein
MSESSTGCVRVLLLLLRLFFVNILLLLVNCNTIVRRLLLTARSTPTVGVSVAGQ